MPDFAQLLPDTVNTTLAQSFDKIKMNSENYNYQNEIVKGFLLAEVNKPFHNEDFISLLRLIKNYFRINFVNGYLLRENSELRYYYHCIQNSCSLAPAFQVDKERDVDAFWEFFVQGRWLAIEMYKNICPDT